jgi:hypothetical protein
MSLRNYLHQVLPEMAPGDYKGSQKAHTMTKRLYIRTYGDRLEHLSARTPIETHTRIDHLELAHVTS